MIPLGFEPNPGPQTEFLASTAREVLFGGAVGGGKTIALVVMPLRWAHHPMLRAIYLRRLKDDSREAIDRVRDLYPRVMRVPSGYGWHETEFRWRFPAGGFLQFGYAQHEQDIEQYRTHEYNLIMFDELTEFDRYQYTFMLTRNRAKTADLPLMIRGATNPGGVGADWVDQRFLGTRPDGTQAYQPYVIYSHSQEIEGIGGRKPRTLSITRQFIPSTVFDNPRLPNAEAYIAGLAHLPDVEREAMLYGRWGRFKGQYFKKAPREVEPGIKSAVLHGRWSVVRAMDYGWSDPLAVLWLVVYEDGLVEVAGELYDRELIVDSVVQLGGAIQADIAGGDIERRLVASVLSPDAFKAGQDGQPSIAHNFGRAGWWFTPANNERLSGWAQILRLIEQDRLRVWRSRAPNLMRTLMKLPHDPNDPRDVKKRKVEDHAPEALRYGCMALTEPFNKAEQESLPGSPNVDPYWESTIQRLEDTQQGKSNRVYLPGLGEGW